MAGVASAAQLWRNRGGTWHTLTPKEKRVAALKVRDAAVAWTELVGLVRSAGGKTTPMLVTQKAHDLLHILYCLEVFGSSDATTTGLWSLFRHFCGALTGQCCARRVRCSYGRGAAQGDKSSGEAHQQACPAC
jgi:hypothetical protein